jgi:hypothetical protein
MRPTSPYKQSDRSTPAIPPPATLAGWDIGLAAFALACMTAGFWRLWPGAMSLSDAPLGPTILKAGLAALGFVAIATRWEDTFKALARNPLILVLLGLACSSAIWAIIPADALRNAIMLIVIWCFGVALSLRFKAKELAEICGFAGLFGLVAQFGAHQGLPPVSAFDGDVAFAILGGAWAAWCVPARRSMWLLLIGCCSALAFAAGDLASLGAGVGVILGLGVAQVGSIRGRQGTISIIVTAWALVALIFGVTVFALFGAIPVTTKISSFFDALGPNMVLGQGFGVAGQSVSSSLGAGLGIVGVCCVGVIVFASLFQVLFGKRHVGKSLDGSIAMWFGSLGAILVSPSDVAIFGPVCILFATTSFTITLSCISLPRRRPALMEIRHTPPRSSMEAVPRLPIRSTQASTSTLNAMGLRPKR